MIRRPLVYLSGPYTVPDPAENTNVALRCADALLEMGVVPVVPHLSLLWQTFSPKPYATWMAIDAQMLPRCDLVVRLPGFSRGADFEEQWADDAGIPISRLPELAWPAHIDLSAVANWVEKRGAQ
jgi:hypothetical protein